MIAKTERLSALVALAVAFLLAHATGLRADSDEEFDRLARAVLQLTQTGYLAEAERAARQMCRLAEGPLKAQPLRLAEAKGYHAHACVCQGHLAKAELLYRQTLQIGDALLPQVHPKRCLFYQGLAYLYLVEGRYGESESLYREAADIAQRVYPPNDPELGRSLGNLALVCLQQGRLADAEALYKRSRAIYVNAFNADVVKTGTIPLGLAAIYNEQGRYSDAQRILEEGMTQIEPTGEASPFHFWLADTYRLQGKYADAERMLRQGMSRIVVDRPGGARYLRCLASVCMLQGRYSEAETHYRRALTVQRKYFGKTHAEVGETLLEIAVLDLVRERYSEAENHLNDAITSLDSAGALTKTRWKAYRRRAELAWKTNRREKAIGDLTTALDLAEQWASHTSGEDSERARTSTEYLDMFETMVSWQKQSGNTGEAYVAMECAHARTLLEQLATRELDLFRGIPQNEADKLRTRLRSAQVDMASLRKQIEILDTRKDLSVQQRIQRRQELTVNLRAACEEFVAARGDLRNASPTYRLAVGEDRRCLPLDELEHQVLKEDTLLVEYLLGQDHSYLMIVPARGDPRIVELTVSDAQADAIGIEPGALTATRLESVLRNKNGTGILQLLRQPNDSGRVEQMLARLAALWKVLVPKRERTEILANKYRRVIVIPDAALANLPFEMLVVEQGKDPRYLLDVGPPIQYAPSATVLMNLAERQQKMRQAAAQPILTVGDCRYRSSVTPEPESALAQLDARARYRDLGGQFNSLPYSAVEVLRVSQSFKQTGTKVAWLRAERATESAVRLNVPGRRVVHFACHGLVDDRYGNLFGALALTPGPRPDDPDDDGFLTLAEIYDLDLKGCELAILSACDTNAGPTQRGEGVWALSRGFLVAGARRVVASNWLVDDAAAATLIGRFCENLAQAEANHAPLDHADALRKAKLAVRNTEKWKGPYYWAAFVLVGPN